MGFKKALKFTPSPQGLSLALLGTDKDICCCSPGAIWKLNLWYHSVFPLNTKDKPKKTVYSLELALKSKNSQLTLKSIKLLRKISQNLKGQVDLNKEQSELDESTLTPEEAKRNRKHHVTSSRGYKSIENAIAHSKSIEAEHYEECMRMHTKCSAEVVAGPDSEEKEKVEKWAYDLDGAYTLVNEAVETYVAKRTQPTNDHASKKKRRDRRKTLEWPQRTSLCKNYKRRNKERQMQNGSRDSQQRAETAAEDHAASLIIIKTKTQLLSAVMTKKTKK
ncbi:hypothetical protein OUZ56_033479 [Daphnia magna]|uniref:Uncharacterized protein n=1 Tax=Daphnia magna TaxID=35525 RepID=A0ABR0BB30_9CRUS|nr:hypothetical protein OUZ56_033479 [Daphnia magna]